LSAGPADVEPTPFTEAPPTETQPDTSALEPATSEPEFETYADFRRVRRERRRYERGEVRRFTKRARRRRLIWLGSAGAVVVLILGVVVTAFSPLMALHTIDVEGTQRIDSAAIQRALAPQLGRPLPLISLGQVHSELERFPLIRSYSIESLPPGTLVVQVVERQPIGVVQNGSEFDVVDPARVTITSSQTRPAGLPVIKVGGAVGSAGEKRGFAAAVAVLRALPATVLGRVDSISAATEDDVTLSLANGPTVVWGSAAQSELKAADLSRLMAAPGASGVSEYDVSSPYSVVAR
jgi:cell division protein FtsQ